MGVAGQIERILRERFEPTLLELRDDSHRHAGHRGATSGGGHFRVALVSPAFEGLSRLEQHRLVNAALAELFGERIHALQLTTAAPSEWAGRQPIGASRPPRV